LENAESFASLRRGYNDRVEARAQSVTNDIMFSGPTEFSSGNAALKIYFVIPLCSQWCCPSPYPGRSSFGNTSKGWNQEML
jgi:hypothetical protein